jgi:hypothetical protein
VKTQRITGDAGMFFAVAVPSESYRAHVGRIEKALSMLGYDAVPLTGEDIIRAARQVEHDLEQFNDAQAALQRLHKGGVGHAARRPKDQGELARQHRRGALV